MKKIRFIFATFILGFFAFQNAYSGEPRIMHQDSSYNRFVLWRVYIQPLDSNARMYATIDSVLRGKKNFYTDKKWHISSRIKTSEIILSPNTYYIVLANALCDTPNRICKLTLLYEGDCLLLDTPENRIFLSKKWDETKVIYTNPQTRPRVKGRDIDM